MIELPYRRVPYPHNLGRTAAVRTAPTPVPRDRSTAIDAALAPPIGRPPIGPPVSGASGAAISVSRATQRKARHRARAADCGVVRSAARAERVASFPVAQALPRSAPSVNDLVAPDSDNDCDLVVPRFDQSLHEIAP